MTRAVTPSSSARCQPTLLTPPRAFPTMRRWVSVGEMVNVMAGKEAVEGKERQRLKARRNS